jgi:hypothetical protein
MKESRRLRIIQDYKDACSSVKLCVLDVIASDGHGRPPTLRSKPSAFHQRMGSCVEMKWRHVHT